jgi:hypothetical protein
MYVKKTSYTAEENALFCNEGYYLFGLKCAGSFARWAANENTKWLQTNQ